MQVAGSASPAMLEEPILSGCVDDASCRVDAQGESPTQKHIGYPLVSSFIC